jgi:hypothetical protein
MMVEDQLPHVSLAETSSRALPQKHLQLLQKALALVRGALPQRLFFDNKNNFANSCKNAVKGAFMARAPRLCLMDSLPNDISVQIHFVPFLVNEGPSTY